MFFYMLVNLSTAFHLLYLTLTQRVKGIRYPRPSWHRTLAQFPTCYDEVNKLVLAIIKGSPLYHRVLKGHFKRRHLVLTVTMDERTAYINLYRPVIVEHQSGIISLSTVHRSSRGLFTFFMKDGHLVNPPKCRTCEDQSSLGYFPDDPVLSYQFALSNCVQRILGDYLYRERTQLTPSESTPSLALA